jgi:hypothetical protein
VLLCVADDACTVTVIDGDLPFADECAVVLLVVTRAVPPVSYLTATTVASCTVRVVAE